jgi:hypothetical protein
VKKVSKMLKEEVFPGHFPVRGKDGYAGEQDGSRAVLTEGFHFYSRRDADESFPEGLPDYVRVHTAHYTPGHGWNVTFGWWSDHPTEEKNPLIPY